jgi:hypothetical protein
MRVRLAIVSWFVGCVLAMNTVVLADPHPVCNKLSTKRAWQIEYDRDHPRDGNYAVRLIIPETENTGAAGFPTKVKLSACTLYRFNQDDGTNYVLKVVGEGGKVENMLGYVDLAPEIGTGNTHWAKASMRLDLTGNYTNTGGTVQIVYVVGSLHPGHKNKKTGRDDYRLVFRPYEVPSTIALQKALEKLYSEKGKESDALKAFRKLFFDSIPCDELPPDAAAEGSYTAPTLFPYTPTLP